MWLRGLVDTTQQVLVERLGDRGHAGNFAEVLLPPQESGSIVEVTITRIQG